MASAAISAGTSILGGIAAGKGAKKAAKIQAQAYQQGIDEQRRQFNTVQANNQPYMAAGNQGLDSLLTLLGIGGRDATGAIDALKASPQFTSLYDTGQDTILQNAAATGGLRGGNTQNSLAQFGSDLLAQVIQQRIGNLGSLVNVGQSAASGTNAAAMDTGKGIAGSLAAQGVSKGTGAAAPYAAFQQILNGIGGSMASSGGTTPTGAGFASSYGFTPWVPALGGGRSW